MKRKLIKTAGINTAMQDKVYKIFTESEWKAFQETGRFSGSVDDFRDGFIHLSTKDQVTGVIDKFFAGKRPLYVAGFSALEFLGSIKWEASVSGEVFPHLYGNNLYLDRVVEVNRLSEQQLN